jgi:hypothetical protein
MSGFAETRFRKVMDPLAAAASVAKDLCMLKPCGIRTLKRRIASIRARRLARYHEYGNAAEIYMRAGDLVKAGDSYFADDQYGNAALAYEKARQWKRAAKAYSMLDNHEKEAECLVKTGEILSGAWLSAGRKCLMDGNGHLALKCFRKMPRGPLWADAAILLGEYGLNEAATKAMEMVSLE